MTIQEFQAMDLRVGKVLAVERVEGSDKMLKLRIDIGEERIILSGIGKAYAPEEIEGKNIVVIANLDPRMIMGQESNGMVLAAHGEDGKPVLIMPVEGVPSGAKIS